MKHTPFGYNIENGQAVIDSTAAQQVQAIYHNYLSGDTLVKAASKSGINKSHSSINLMLSNKRYLGDEYYPPIIDATTFEQTQAERYRRATALNRHNFRPIKAPPTIRTSFIMKPEVEHYDDPFEQAQYTYSLIESEKTNEQ